MTRPGAPSRRAETTAVAAALARWMPTREISDPATLDGGDVLRVGATLYVGRSTRTNDAGIAQVRQMAAADGLRVLPAPVRGVLHLKSAVAVLDDETLLIAPRHTDPSLFTHQRLIEKAAGEEHNASALRLRSGAVAIATTAPRTIERVVSAGFDVIPVDVSQFQAVDGGLTCLSILDEGDA